MSHTSHQLMEGIEETVRDDLIDKMTQILRRGLNNPDCFVYENQERVIRALTEEKHVLYIDGTGNGKSETYFIASKLLREQCSQYGPVIVVAPLKSLIEDQLARARAFGLTAAAYNSNMNDVQKGDVILNIRNNVLDVLFLTPEMIRSFTDSPRHKLAQLPQFHQTYKPISGHKWTKVPLIVIDEIHYISKGHRFRSSYLEIWDLVRAYPWFKNALRLGMTATYSKSVENDVRRELYFDETLYGSCYRENIAIRVIPSHVSHAKKGWLETLATLDETRNILVFCLSRNECRELSAYLANHSIERVNYYFANRPDSAGILKQFVDGSIRILVATFDSIGAGFNKTDIHDVVWMYTPSSMADFYQGIGRAGRDGHSDCKGYLLTSKPWRKDLCLEVFVIIGNTLRDVGDQMNVKELIDRVKPKFLMVPGIEKTVHEAIDYGETKGVFNVRNSLISLVSSNEVRIKEEYLKSRSEEVVDMENLNNCSAGRGGCCWKLVLDKLRGDFRDDWKCGKCSSCSPAGDHQPDFYLDGACYMSELDGVQVYALGQGGDQVTLNSSVIRKICNRFIPDIDETPPEWAISFVPDSSGTNEENINSLAECLNHLSVVKFVHIDPHLSHLKMYEAKTDETKEAVLRKYFFDASKLQGVRKLLIYDDCINTGKTIQKILTVIRSQSQISDVRFLVQRIYPRVGRSIQTVDLTAVRA